MGPPSDDAAIVALCRAGDEAAWRELVERFSRYVYAIAVQGFQLSQHDAEDVFQDVFTRMYERLGQLRSDESVRPWLAQLTRRVCLDRGRASPHLLVDGDVSEELPADDVLEDLEQAWEIREELERMPEPCRDILERFFVLEESYRTIGEALQLPPGTIASRISRCLKQLRERVEGRKPPVRESSVQVTR